MAESNDVKTVPFHSIGIGNRFVFKECTYEKTKHAGGGCCNKKFNAVNLDLEEPKIFGRNEKVILVEN